LNLSAAKFFKPSFSFSKPQRLGVGLNFIIKSQSIWGMSIKTFHAIVKPFRLLTKSLALALETILLNSYQVK